MAGPVNGSATPEELQDRVRATLGRSMSRILDVLLKAYPKSLRREALAEASDFEPNSGGYNNYIGRMHSMGIVEYPVPGEVVACAVLFLEGG